MLAVAMACLLASAAVPLGVATVRGETLPDHLVISEVVTGGASASDELIEIYNPTATAMPLEGLELVYVSASGVTVSRRAAWEAGAPDVPPGHHVLVANEAGAYAAIADAVYASGMAATGGSVALRILGASSAIDAVGWGSAASAWLERAPAVAPAAGSSIERLPGGTAGSTQDTDDNAADFVERVVPDPQNAGSAPTPDPSQPPPTPTPTVGPTTGPTPAATPTPAPTETPTATPTDAPVVVSVAAARAAPEGTALTIEAIALTDAAFSDGGGFVADGSGGIAVLLSSGTFARGDLVRVSGTLDDRFAQRTLRSDADGVVRLGTGGEPSPIVVATGAIGEAQEASLVRVGGTILGAPTQLSAGPAYDLDDGSGPVRVLVATTTGIDTAGWKTGARIETVGIVGQRDSSGTGAAGYRVMPRVVTDVVSVTPPPDTDPSTGPDPSGPGASPTAGPDGISQIADVRALAKNANATVRGTVTMASGVIDAGSAVIQDASGAILLRLGGDVGALRLGDRVEVTGVRSTLQGMETLRVTTPARRLGTTEGPSPASLRTGDAGEDHEAMLVKVRGALVASARRAGTGSVSFEIDDGSGPLRVYLAAALGADTADLQAGAWIEVSGVLGQETTGALPTRGYRVWPRLLGEVRVTAAATGGGENPSGGGGGGAAGSAGADGAPAPDLAGLDAPNLTGAEVGATLVSGPWPELGIGGLLWDGDRLVAIAPHSAPGVRGVIASAGRPPLALELRNLGHAGTARGIDLPQLRLGGATGDVVARDTPVHAPHVAMPRGDAAWVALVGRLTGRDAPRLVVGGGRATPAVELRCDDVSDVVSGTVQVTGIGLADPPRIVVPCGGIRPAPVLAGGVAGASGPPDRPTASDSVAPAPASAEPPRWGAAGLLGVGALLVLSAAGIARRLEPGERERDPALAATEPEPHVEPPEAAVSPQPLALVAVPREHGS